MKPQSLASAVGFAFIFGVLVGPASADIVPCASGNLATIVDSTCNIGNLQFTFGYFGGQNPTGTAETWFPSDFTFTALANGFELSGPPPQTVTGSDYTDLPFYVADLAGEITGTNVSGGNLSVSGTGPIAVAQESLSLNDYSLVPNADVSSLNASNTLQDIAGTVTDYLQNSNENPPLLFGLGGGGFDLFASAGNTAGIDSTTEDFTFTTVPGPPNPPFPNPYAAPEPSPLPPLSLGVLILGCAARYKVHALKRTSPAQFPPSDGAR